MGGENPAPLQRSLHKKCSSTRPVSRGVNFQDRHIFFSSSQGGEGRKKYLYCLYGQKVGRGRVLSLSQEVHKFTLLQEGCWAFGEETPPADEMLGDFFFLFSPPSFTSSLENSTLGSGSRHRIFGSRRYLDCFGVTNVKFRAKKQFRERHVGDRGVRASSPARPRLFQKVFGRSRQNAIFFPPPTREDDDDDDDAEEEEEEETEQKQIIPLQDRSTQNLPPGKKKIPTNIFAGS